MRNLIVMLSLFALLATFVFAVGCAAPTPAPNPLAGFSACFSQDPNNLDKAISDDYNAYVQNLPAKERKHVGPIQLFEDRTGQHAVRIEIALNGTDWAHVLIYDKENKRVKAIKFISGHYRC